MLSHPVPRPPHLLSWIYIRLSLHLLPHLAFLVSAAAEARLHDVVEALTVLTAHLLQAATLQELLLGLLLALLQDLLTAPQLRAHALLGSCLRGPPRTAPASTTCWEQGSTSAWMETQIERQSWPCWHIYAGRRYCTYR